MAGKFQGENVAVSLATIETLQMNGIYITDDSITEGIEKTTNPGRMEIVGFEPIILIDGAHNVAGIRSLKDTLKEDFVYERLILVIGILSDKNIQEMLDIITPIADVIIATKSHNKRACEPSKLKKMISKEVIVKNKISDAIGYAKKVAKKQDLICITGSLFTAGEVKDYIKEYT
jgi:dihydrofolate synthase/folylpolyglutamate synthase